MEILSDDSLKFIKQKTNEILEYKNNNWENIELKLKLKIINSLLKIKNQNIIIINLKHRKPLKLMMIIYAIERKDNKYKNFNNKILDYTREFRIKYNKNKNLCFTGLGKIELDKIIESYNNLIYEMLTIKTLEINDLLNLFNNPDEYNIFLNNNSDILRILKNENTITIECTNNNEIILELYLTSNKITNNLPFKYKIKLRVINDD
jgi:hypothetical protein